MSRQTLQNVFPFCVNSTEMDDCDEENKDFMDEITLSADQNDPNIQNLWLKEEMQEYFSRIIFSNLIN